MLMLVLLPLLVLAPARVMQPVTVVVRDRDNMQPMVQPALDLNQTMGMPAGTLRWISRASPVSVLTRSSPQAPSLRPRGAGPSGSGVRCVRVWPALPVRAGKMPLHTHPAPGGG